MIGPAATMAIAMAIGMVPLLIWIAIEAFRQYKSVQRKKNTESTNRQMWNP